MRMRVLREKLRVENENESSEGKNEIEIENETLNFQEWGMSHKSTSFMTLHIKIFIIEASKWSEMLEKLPLKSTKYSLDYSNFWEFENESWEWEWEFSQ